MAITLSWAEITLLLCGAAILWNVWGRRANGVRHQAHCASEPHPGPARPARTHPRCGLGVFGWILRMGLVVSATLVVMSIAMMLVIIKSRRATVISSEPVPAATVREIDLNDVVLSTYNTPTHGDQNRSVALRAAEIDMVSSTDVFRDVFRQYLADRPPSVRDGVRAIEIPPVPSVPVPPIAVRERLAIQAILDTGHDLDRDPASLALTADTDTDHIAAEQGEIAEPPVAVAEVDDEVATAPTPRPRPAWLDGKLPDEPNTRFRVIPTASLLTADQSREAMAIEVEHALQEYVDELVEELGTFGRIDWQPEDLRSVLREQYLEVLGEESNRTYRSHALVAFTPKVREALTSRIRDSMIGRRLRTTGVVFGTLLALLGLSYGGLRMLGGSPRLVWERRPATI